MKAILQKALQTQYPRVTPEGITTATKVILIYISNEYGYGFIDTLSSNEQGLDTSKAYEQAIGLVQRATENPIAFLREIHKRNLCNKYLAAFLITLTPLCFISIFPLMFVSWFSDISDGALVASYVSLGLIGTASLIIGIFKSPNNCIIDRDLSTDLLSLEQALGISSRQPQKATAAVTEVTVDLNSNLLTQQGNNGSGSGVELQAVSATS